MQRPQQGDTKEADFEKAPKGGESSTLAHPHRTQAEQCLHTAPEFVGRAPRSCFTHGGAASSSLPVTKPLGTMQRQPKGQGSERGRTGLRARELPLTALLLQNRAPEDCIPDSTLVSSTVQFPGTESFVSPPSEALLRALTGAATADNGSTPDHPLLTNQWGNRHTDLLLSSDPSSLVPIK